MAQFDHDVAFSFLAEDEDLALRFSRELESRASTFVYSEHQKELAGTDGVDKFSQVFAEQCRVCVVLFREGWGQSPWTRVEEAAIKTRGITHGWDFLLVISLDGRAPLWLPRPQLWLGWERFGIEAAIAVIERKITESGGDIRAQSAVDLALLKGERQRQDEERTRFLHSEGGVGLAKTELARFFDLISEKVARIRSGAPALGISIRRFDAEALAITSPGYAVSLAWSRQYSNTLQYSSLVVKERAGPYVERQIRGAPVITRDVHVTFTTDDRGAPAWVHDDEPQRLYSTEALSERYISVVVEHAQDDPVRTRHEEDDDFD